MITEHYQKVLLETYPSTSGLTDFSSQVPYIVSPQVATLPQSVFERVQTCVQKIYEYAHRPERVQKLRATLNPHAQNIIDARVRVKNASVLMAYDFHYDPVTTQLSLIEINTNASAFLLSELIYRITKGACRNSERALQNLKASFENELSLMGRGSAPRVLIMDETPEQQKMYVEFLMFRDLFRSWGWTAEICDPAYAVQAIANNEVDFIYNRYNDFLLDNEGSGHLYNAYLGGNVIFSPNPYEYLVLAEKSNLIEFAEHHVSEALIPTFHLKRHPDQEAVWAQKKKYIFKPTNLYGAKAVYRGSSVSRRVFDEIREQDFIAQEYRPPATQGEWKYDLRFYAYQSEIHLCMARFYQGQVTNFRSLGGGLAPINFI